MSLDARFDPFTPPPAVTPIASCAARRSAAISGRVVRVDMTDWSGNDVLEVTVSDGTGKVVLAFFGRRRPAGVELGQPLTAGGALIRHLGRLLILNPYYWLSPSSSPAPDDAV